MKLENNTLWNEAARWGLLFGLFSSLCLGLKEAAALSGSTFAVQAAGIILWAVEFFGCILLMKRCMLSLRDRLDLEVHDLGNRFFEGCPQGFIFLSGLHRHVVDLIRRGRKEPGRPRKALMLTVKEREGP